MFCWENCGWYLFELFECENGLRLCYFMLNNSLRPIIIIVYGHWTCELSYFITSFLKYFLCMINQNGHNTIKQVYVSL